MLNDIAKKSWISVAKAEAHANKGVFTGFSRQAVSEFLDNSDPSDLISRPSTADVTHPDREEVNCQSVVGRRISKYHTRPH